MYTLPPRRALLSGTRGAPRLPKSSHAKGITKFIVRRLSPMKTEIIGGNLRNLWIKKGFLSGIPILGSWWRESRLARSRQASGRQVRQGHVFGEVFMRSPCGRGYPAHHHRHQQVRRRPHRRALRRTQPDRHGSQAVERSLYGWSSRYAGLSGRQGGTVVGPAGKDAYRTYGQHLLQRFPQWHPLVRAGGSSGGDRPRQSPAASRPRAGLADHFVTRTRPVLTAWSAEWTNAQCPRNNKTAPKGTVFVAHPLYVLFLGKCQG